MAASAAAAATAPVDTLQAQLGGGERSTGPGASMGSGTPIGGSFPATAGAGAIPSTACMRGVNVLRSDVAVQGGRINADSRK